MTVGRRLAVRLPQVHCQELREERGATRGGEETGERERLRAAGDGGATQVARRVG